MKMNTLHNLGRCFRVAKFDRAELLYSLSKIELHMLQGVPKRTWIFEITTTHLWVNIDQKSNWFLRWGKDNMYLKSCFRIRIFWKLCPGRESDINRWKLVDFMVFLCFGVFYSLFLTWPDPPFSVPEYCIIVIFGDMQYILIKKNDFKYCLCPIKGFSLIFYLTLPINVPSKIQVRFGTPCIMMYIIHALYDLHFSGSASEIVTP